MEKRSQIGKVQEKCFPIKHYWFAPTFEVIKPKVPAKKE
jgi:hypothetical protein